MAMWNSMLIVWLENLWLDPTVWYKQFDVVWGWFI